MYRVGIIIRTKNEERWIGYCIKALKVQSGIDCMDIVLVDCNSTDMTVQRAKSIIPGIRVVKYVGEYFPGKSINKGVAALNNADYIVILSAHCIPLGNNWLLKMIGPLHSNSHLAASYCRQIPTLASTPENRRDLLNTFSVESRFQTRDSFFHNAASVVRREVWSKIQFDEDIKHIEDRHWAIRVLAQGYKIFYNADAVVTHEHGLNQHDRKYRSFRGQGVSDLLQEDVKLCSEWLLFAEAHSDLLVLTLSSGGESQRLRKIIDSGVPEKNCFLLPKKGSDSSISPRTIRRVVEWEEISLFDLLRELLLEFSSKGNFFDYVYFFDADKSGHRGRLPFEYVRLSLETGADLCVPVESYKEDFFVLQSNEKTWVPICKNVMDLYENKPHFKKALYGHGMLIRVSNVLNQEMPESVFLDG